MKLLESCACAGIGALILTGCLATVDDLRELDDRWSGQGYATVGDLTAKAEEIEARTLALAESGLSAVETGGIGGLATILGMVGLNMYRNATRKSDPNVSNEAAAERAAKKVEEHMRLRKLEELEAAAKAKAGLSP